MPALQYTDLASQANDFMTGQAIKPLITNLPQYATNVGQRSLNTNQMLKGQLPDDVIRQISQQAAERGIATGSPGSSNSNAAYLRSLGLNSLQMMGQGSQELTRSIADTPIPQIWNPLSLQVPQMLARSELDAARTGRGAGAGGVRMPPAAPMSFSTPTLNWGQGSGGPLSVSGPAGGGPGSPLSTNDWWAQYGGHNLTSTNTGGDPSGGNPYYNNGQWDEVGDSYDANNIGQDYFA